MISNGLFRNLPALLKSCLETLLHVATSLSVSVLCLLGKQAIKHLLLDGLVFALFLQKDVQCFVCCLLVVLLAQSQAEVVIVAELVEGLDD